MQVLLNDGNRLQHWVLSQPSRETSTAVRTLDVADSFMGRTFAAHVMLSRGYTGCCVMAEHCPSASRNAMGLACNTHDTRKTCVQSVGSDA
jgi:hypothetical protein